MDEKDINGFSIPTLLLTTGASFLLFALVLRILDGVIMKFFIDTGVLAFLAGVITGVFILIRKKTQE